MFVILPGSWLSHNFLKGQFKISSQKQIAEVARQGISEVTVDYARSDNLPINDTITVEELEHISHSDAPVDPKNEPPPAKWCSQDVVPQAFLSAIEDKSLPPEHKSKVVYDHSVEMMKKLLDSPTAENIRASKGAISAITDMILSDDQTANNLLRITSHDFYTYTHSVNVGVTGIMLSKELFKKSDAHNLHELGAGFFLHDLGKINVDAAIINKPGRLTDAEMKRMRIHPYQGYKILEQADALSEECRYIIMQHHELDDGSGYPKRLKGDGIHIYGKMCCIADIFDALTAERSYKKAMSPFDALKLMKGEMAYHFDRELFESFVLLFR